MSVRQVAEYLNINEKKIYALVSEGKIPGTKITGKWTFPRELVDRWMLESSHGGLLTDRLVVAGSDDPLLYRLVIALAARIQAHGLVSYTPTGTRLGLALLNAHRADVCGIHWGPSDESHLRHPALISQYPMHRNWVLIHGFQREQGLIVSPRQMQESTQVESLLSQPLRWAMRQEGAGAQRFLLETLSRYGVDANQLKATGTAGSEREAAAQVAMGQADIAPGARSVASEYGLGFVSTGWESFDFALNHGIYFRRLFQQLLETLKAPETRALAEELGGYNLDRAGQLVWSHEE
ncbi:MAG: helix-turn-helix transcriptional regulator [Gammaproteobacteria bacterium]